MTATVFTSKQLVVLSSDLLLDILHGSRMALPSLSRDECMALSVNMKCLHCYLFYRNKKLYFHPEYVWMLVYFHWLPGGQMCKYTVIPVAGLCSPGVACQLLAFLPYPAGFSSDCSRLSDGGTLRETMIHIKAA